MFSKYGVLQPWPEFLKKYLQKNLFLVQLLTASLQLHQNDSFQGCFLKILIIVLELLYCKTAACKTPIIAKHFLLVASKIIWYFCCIFPQLVTHQVVYVLLVFQIGYNPSPLGHFSFDKRVAKIYSLLSCYKERWP